MTFHENFCDHTSCAEDIHRGLEAALTVLLGVNLVSKPLGSKVAPILAMIKTTKEETVLIVVLSTYQCRLVANDISEEYLVTGSNEYILRLNITMNHAI